ncbi:hypothetical protein GCM10020258_26250 [Sphingomonas yabuuchiae]
MTLTINASFDGGNIRVVAIEGDRVDLEIVKDKDPTFTSGSISGSAARRDGR